MLIELGILVGVVVRRSRHFIALLPLRHDDPSKLIWAHNLMEVNRESDPVMSTTDEWIGDDKHILCGLPLAVRERIERKSINANTVLHATLEKIEEMMSTVASKWWWECLQVWN